MCIPHIIIFAIMYFMLGFFLVFPPPKKRIVMMSLSFVSCFYCAPPLKLGEWGLHRRCLLSNDGRTCKTVLLLSSSHAAAMAKFFGAVTAK